MNHARFFVVQFLCVMAWLVGLGSLAFVVYHGDDILMVLQGWATDTAFEIEA